MLNYITHTSQSNSLFIVFQIHQFCYLQNCVCHKITTASAFTCSSLSSTPNKPSENCVLPFNQWLGIHSFIILPPKHSVKSLFIHLPLTCLCLNSKILSTPIKCIPQLLSNEAQHICAAALPHHTLPHLIFSNHKILELVPFLTLCYLD